MLSLLSCHHSGKADPETRGNLDPGYKKGNTSAVQAGRKTGGGVHTLSAPRPGSTLD